MMRNRSTLHKTVLTCVFALSLASCAMFQGRETAGQYVDDATITTKVKEAFVADKYVSANQVSVETMQGVVQLSGFVDSASKEQRAVQLARNVSGVKSVKDDIIVRGSANN